jgi:hypothetical protein
MPPVAELIKSGLAQGTFVVQSDGVVECVDTIELRPVEKGAGWKNAVDFHPNLNLSLLSSINNDDDDDPSFLYLTFEGKARECLEVALSPIPKFSVDSTTVIRLGGYGNTATTVTFGRSGRRMSKKKQRAPLSSFQRVTGRVCRYDCWVKYWLCYDQQQGRVSVGIGDRPGEDRITSLQLPAAALLPTMPQQNNKATSAKEEEEEPADEKTHTMEQEKNETSTTEEAAPKRHVSYRAVGFRNVSVADRQKPTPLLIRNIRLSRTIPSDVQMDRLMVATTTGVGPALEEPVDAMIILGHDKLSSLSATDQQAVQLLLAHQEACIKARARAVKFNVPYVEPDLAASLNWSDARRLQANPTRQPRSFFATGVDVSSQEELEKRNQRKERFGVETTIMSPNDQKNRDTWLPLEEAWDKLELSGMQRLDPPAELWLDHPVGENNQFALEPATLVKTKIHIFSMDWASFKQIRTSDILHHFSEFGPTYVEWLGDLSCNILFVDEYSAIRAMNRMAQELPFGKDPDLGRMGWRFGKTYLRKVADDKFGKKGTTARLLMRLATSKDVLQQRPTWWPKPPAGFSTTKMLGPESDAYPESAVKKQSQKRQAASTEEILNSALASPRGGGFSLAALEIERASKRTKPS